MESGSVGHAHFDFKCYCWPARRLLRPTLKTAQDEHPAERNDMSSHSTKPAFLRRSQEGLLQELFLTLGEPGQRDRNPSQQRMKRSARPTACLRWVTASSREVFRR